MAYDFSLKSFLANCHYCSCFCSWYQKNEKRFFFSHSIHELYVKCVSKYSIKHQFIKYSTSIILYVFPASFDPKDKSSLDQCYTYLPIISSAHKFTFSFSSHTILLQDVFPLLQWLELIQSFAVSGVCTLCSLSLEESFPSHPLMADPLSSCWHLP